VAATDRRAGIELRSVGRTGGRGRLAALAWAASLAGLVGIALVGRLAAGPSTAEPADAAASESPPTGPASAGTAIRDAPRLALLEPGVAATFSAGTIAIVGERSDGGEGGSIRLAVQDEHGRTLDVSRFETDGRRFEGALQVPNPPIAGRVWLQVAAYAPDGSVVAVTTRALRVAADDGSAPAPPAPSPRPIGEDGIMGGRPFEHIAGG
jgi:hypothetical protein